ncbi:MAG: DUF1376 domain-containing protein [Planctomycetota bacterium]
MDKVKFVQLEPEAFLSDGDFQAMSDAERGVYWSLILYLYCNNGRLRLDFEKLARLCGCQSFEQVWSRIGKKFSLRGGCIRHKRVSAELKRARQFMQSRREAGLKGAARRWHSQRSPMPTKRNENVKESKAPTNTNPPGQSLSSSSSVRVQGLNFYEALTALIMPRTQSDRTCFRNVTNWLIEGCATGRFDERIFERVLDYAKEATTGRNPAAVFMTLIKKELGYK